MFLGSFASWVLLEEVEGVLRGVFATLAEGDEEGIGGLGGVEGSCGHRSAESVAMYRCG